MRLDNKAARRFFKKKAAKKGDDPLWSLVKDKFDLAMDLRRPFERQWVLSLAFLVGRQYAFFNSAAHMLQEIKLSSQQRKFIDNILMPKWRRQVTDFASSRPAISVVPNTKDDEDVQAAKLADKVLKHCWRELKFDSIRRMIGGWIFLAGNAFLVDRWDPKRGPIAYDGEKVVYKGDVALDLWSPFEVGVPAVGLGCWNIHEFPWVILHKRQTLEWIKENYKKDVAAESNAELVVDVSALFTGGISNAELKEDGANVIQLLMKPCSDYPKGLSVVMANSVLLRKDDFPFNEYPIAHFKDIEIPGSFWGKATIEDAIPAQIRWNRNLNDLDAFNRTMARGKLLVPRGSQMETEADDRHGEIINYKPVLGHKPEQLTLKGLPSTYDQAQMFVHGSLENIFSQHEVSRGTNKSDIRSGSMVSLLREQDVAGNGMPYAIFEQEMSAVFTRLLKRIQLGYDSNRMIKVAGKEGEFEVIQFKGADLRENTDVMVKPDSALPESRVLRQEIIMGRFEKGLYGNPADPEVRRKVMNLLEDAVVEDIYEETKRDEAYANWENMLLVKNQTVTYLVNSYDNHQVHVKVHTRFMKSIEYQRLKVENPKAFQQVEVIFMQHLQMHDRFIAEQMKQMLANQALAKGAVGNA